MTRGHAHLDVALAPYAIWGTRPTPTPPPAAPCDTCAGPVSRYNPYGRCHLCLGRNPDVPEPAAGRERHAPDCQCKELAARVRQGGKWYRRVPVTCPDCGRGRLSPISGSHGAGPHCTRGYMTLCATCARRRAGGAA